MDRTQNIKVNLPPATQARHDFQAGHAQSGKWTRPAALWLEKEKTNLPGGN